MLKRGPAFTGAEGGRKQCKCDLLAFLPMDALSKDTWLKYLEKWSDSWWWSLPGRNASRFALQQKL